MIPFLIHVLRQTLPGTGVYAVRIPQHADFPAVRISQDGMIPDGTKEHVSAMDTHIVTLDIFHPHYPQAREMAGLIRHQLDRQQFQPLSHPYVAGVTVDGVRDGLYDEDKQLYHLIMDLTVYAQTAKQYATH